MKHISLYEKFRINKIAIHKSILLETQKYLREHGSHHHEGMVFWSGEKHDDIATIRSCINPAQDCTAVSVDISPEESQRINSFLTDKREVLIAQVHTHPGTAFHSHRDDSMPATYAIGFFSLVVPNFCKSDIKTLTELVIVEYVGSGKWKELKNREIKERFTIINN